jgi:hypothetical protein
MPPTRIFIITKAHDVENKIDILRGDDGEPFAFVCDIPRSEREIDLIVLEEAPGACGGWPCNREPGQPYD